MDPEFKSMLFRVLAIGGIVLTISTTALLLAFWKLGKSTPQNEPRAFAILLGVAGLILIFCVVLLSLSPQVR
jgi:multisubunit Na+/H+ antiporter MnhB subunit